MLFIIIFGIIYAAIGALIGLLPYFLCVSQGKPNLGSLSLMLCIISGVLLLIDAAALGFSVLLALIFSVAAFTASRDCGAIFGSGSSVPYHSSPAYYSSSPRSLGLRCLSGPMYGRTYRLGSSGILIGRESDCGIRFFGAAPGVSRHHCSIRMGSSGPALVDLGSSYGSYLADGTKIPPHYPMPIRPGSRFYLGSSQNLFELVEMR